MKKLLFVTAVTVLIASNASALTSLQAQANALNCVEVVKFAAELSSPSLNGFMLKSKKVVFDKSGTIYIIEKAIGDIKYRYLDKNKKPITGKNLADALNNARNNASFVEIDFNNKLMFSAKLLLSYENPSKKHENMTIEGTVGIKSGKDEVTYKTEDKIVIKELTSAATSINKGILKSEGKFKGMIIIDFAKNNANSSIDKKNQAGVDLNYGKRSQKIDNLKLVLAK